MRGLRTQEGSKFERFFSLVQSEAARVGCVFFGDCGEGNEFSTKEMEGEELSGWLIPLDEADAFEKIYMNWDDIPSRWNNRFCWALWENKGSLKISFRCFADKIENELVVSNKRGEGNVWKQR